MHFVFWQEWPLQPPLQHQVQVPVELSAREQLSITRLHSGGQVLSRNITELFAHSLFSTGTSFVPLTREIAEGSPELLSLGSIAQSGYGSVTGQLGGLHPLSLPPVTHPPNPAFLR